MSPYSWFAAERIDRSIPDAEWRPVFAGGLFAAAGRGSWGFDERRSSGIADCEARAAELGLGSVKWPRRWQTVDLAVARAMVVADEAGRLREFALTAMRLAFLEGRDLGEMEVVADAARRVGMDAAALVTSLASPEVKQAIRHRTNEAIALGVIGVPTVAIGSRLFWGDDRLDEAAGVASGRLP